MRTDTDLPTEPLYSPFTPSLISTRCSQADTIAMRKIRGMRIPSFGAVAAGKAGGAGIDIGAIIGQLAGGGVGGGALMAIIGILRSVMAK